MSLAFESPSCILFAQTSVPRSIVTESLNDSLSIGHLTDVFEDKSGQISWKELDRIKKDRWLQSRVEIPSFGFTESSYWLRFTFEPNSKQLEWYLEVAHPLHDVLTLYEQTANGVKPVATIGDRLPFDMRKIKTTNLVFEITLDAEQSKTFWLNSRSESSMAFPLKIWEKHAFHAQLVYESVFKGFYYGMIAVMGLYNLFLFFTSRQLEYLTYVLYIWSSTFFQMALTGLAFQFLWPESTWLANEGIALLAGVLGFFIAAFSQSFLNTREYTPKIHMTLNGLRLLGFSLVIFTLIGPHKVAIQLGNLLSLTTAVIMLFVCAASIYFKIPQARFFVLAFITFFAGVLLVVFKILGVLPTNFLTASGFQIGTALQVVLLSIAVGDKIRIERHQANSKIHKANQQINSLNQKLQALNLDLEEKVHEKTIGLQRRNVQIETILDSLPMGVVTIDHSLRIAQYSKWMAKFFATEDLRGKLIWEVFLKHANLDPDDVDKMLHTIALVVEGDKIAFVANKSHLPSEIVYQKMGANFVIELSWNVIVNELNHVDKLLLIINDVTDARQARLEAIQKSRHLTMVGEIISLPAERFQNFLDNAFDLLDDMDVVLRGEIKLELWYDVLRNIHTIKGNSRSYGLSFLNSKVHMVENILSEISGENCLPSGQKLEHAKEACQEIRDVVAQYQLISHETLNRSASHSKDKLLTRIHHWLGKVVARNLVRDLPDYQTLLAIVDELDQYCKISVEDVLSPIVHSLKNLAFQSGKKTPKLKIINPDKLKVEREKVHLLESVFSHLVRNSIDHGFTNIQEGVITIQVSKELDTLRWIYQDNGRGLDLEKLRKKYLDKLGPGWSQQQVANLIFEDNVSSKDHITEISGRGVGMSAVKKMIGDAGGKIHIEMNPLGQYSLASFSFVIDVPLTMGVLPGQRHTA